MGFYASASCTRKYFRSFMVLALRLFSQPLTDFYIIALGNPPEHREWRQKIPLYLKLFFATGPRSQETYIYNCDKGSINHVIDLTDPATKVTKKLDLSRTQKWRNF